MSNPLSWDEKIAFEIRQKDIVIKCLKSEIKELKEENERLNGQLDQSKKQCRMWFQKFSNVNEKLEKHIRGIGWCK